MTSTSAFAWIQSAEFGRALKFPVILWYMQIHAAENFQSFTRAARIRAAVYIPHIIVARAQYNKVVEKKLALLYNTSAVSP